MIKPVENLRSIFTCKPLYIDEKPPKSNVVEAVRLLEPYSGSPALPRPSTVAAFKLNCVTLWTPWLPT